MLWRNGLPTGRILSQHAISICCAGRSGGGAYNLSDEVHLSRCNHVTDARDVIEHPLDMFISDASFLDSCDRDMKDSADAAMEEDFKLVGKSFAHGPGFASP